MKTNSPIEALQIYSQLLSPTEQVNPKITFSPTATVWNFDPSIHKLEIPLVAASLQSSTQRGYIFSAVCNFLHSTPEKWQQAERLKIPRFVYVWLNQIFSERLIRRMYASSGIIETLNEFYNSYKHEFNKQHNFFQSYWLHDKKHDDSQLQALLQEDADGSLAQLAVACDTVTADTFLSVCEKLTSYYRDEIAKRRKQAEAEQQPSGAPSKNSGPMDLENAGELEEEYRKFVEESQREALEAAKQGLLKKTPKLTKQFSSSVQRNFWQAIHFTPNECLKLNNTAFVNEGLQRHVSDADFLEYSRFIDEQATELYSEFECHKSALQEADVRFTECDGYLNSNRLAFYGLPPEQHLFSIQEQRRDGRNHGIVFLVDFSTSMFSGDVFEETTKQILMLERFCVMADIPHSIFAFCEVGRAVTNNYELPEWLTNHDKVTPAEYFALVKHHASENLTIIPPPGMKFYELFNETMGPTERSKMERLLFLMTMTKSNGQLVTEFAFGRTPMNNAILMSEVACEELYCRQAKPLEKIAIFLISDTKSGEATYSAAAGTEIVHSTPNCSFEEMSVFSGGNSLRIYDETRESLIDLIHADFALAGVEIKFVTIIPNAIPPDPFKNYEAFAQFTQNGISTQNNSENSLTISCKSFAAIYKGLKDSGAKDPLAVFQYLASTNNVTKSLIREFIGDWS